MGTLREPEDYMPADRFDHSFVYPRVRHPEHRACGELQIQGLVIYFVKALCLLLGFIQFHELRNGMHHDSTFEVLFVVETLRTEHSREG